MNGASTTSRFGTEHISVSLSGLARVGDYSEEWLSTSLLEPKDERRLDLLASLQICVYHSAVNSTLRTTAVSYSRFAEQSRTDSPGDTERHFRTN